MGYVIFVKLFAFAREVVGKDLVKVKIEGDTTVGDVLKDLRADFPQLNGILFDKNGNLRPDYSVFVNEKRLEKRQFYKYHLHSGDTILIYPPVGGGC